MRRVWRERFAATDFKGNRSLAIPACIMARASRATRNFTYLARGPRVAYNKAKQNQRINAFGIEKF